MLKRIVLVGMALAPLALAACAVGPNYVRPQVAAAQTFESAAAPIYTADPAADDFWTQFHDPVLSTLIMNAQLANHDLRIAAARFAEARAVRGATKLDLAPTVTASAGYTQQLYSNPQRPLVPGGEVKLYDASFDAVWELDFFGRVRRSIEAANADTQSAEADLRNARIIVTSEVARNYFELRGAQGELDVARRNVVNQQSTRDLTGARLDAGRGTEFDTARARAQLSTTLSTIAPLEAAVARAMHALSVLTGREPDALTRDLSASAALPTLPAKVAIGNPADLLRQRPDIESSERKLAAATARVGVATADLFPHVTFTGSLGFGADTVGGLGDPGSGTRLIAPSISWAAFDLGRVHKQLVAARARDDAALATYEQTVLRALQETEDALVTHVRAREQLEHVDDAATASETAAQLARIRFEGGMVDFLQVLDAERTQLDAESQLARTRTAAATSLIAVYKALGGAR